MSAYERICAHTITDDHIQGGQDGQLCQLCHVGHLGDVGILNAPQRTAMHRNATHNATHNATLTQRARAKKPPGRSQGALCARDLNYACSAKAMILRS